jgi:hypothetical protein
MEGEEERIMKHFKDAVKRKQEKDGWHVFAIRDSEEPVDLICMRGSRTTLIRARGNGHNHIYGSTGLELRALGARCGTHVLLAKVNGANEIVFTRIYP